KLEGANGTPQPEVTLRQPVEPIRHLPLHQGENQDRSER
ncbi:MAG: hypothetical protein JWP63_4356, partial [Candidatus Solibacter sp.]|nr:hypothetical protein [Candidatus Solibacter sp.]